jgi:hypothetical protein
MDSIFRLIFGHPARTAHRYFGSNFAMFAVLYAAWLLIDMSMPNWLRPKTAMILIPLCIAVIMRPNNVYLVLAMMAASVYGQWAKSPYHVNIGFIAFYVGLCVLLAAAGYILVRRRMPSVAYIEPLAFPAIRLGVILVWFFAVLHKTNWGFLEPTTSCAIVHYRMLMVKLPFLPDPVGTTGHIICWFTWGMEFSVLALLTLGWIKFPGRRTLTVALIVALLFHYGMSFNGHQFFSTMALSSYIPFLPANFYRSIQAGIARAMRSAKAWLMKLFMLGGIGWLLLFALQLLFLAFWKITVNPGRHIEPAIYWEGWVLFNFAAAPTVMLGYFFITYYRRWRPNVLSGHRLAVWVWPLVVLVVISSMSPYVGLKTGNSFAMFSSLLTEGEYWNHCFLPKSMRVFNYQDNMITVLDTSQRKGRLRDLADGVPEGQERVVEFELRRATAELCERGQDPISLTYCVNDGPPIHVPDIRKDSKWSTSNGWWKEKLMLFRDVPIDQTGICLH